ncbi:MAG: RND transporter [Rhodobacterales bacterium CG2_30_65_12]|nr:MAG: RND transporter [Rhodobacterales bacterium CG2_30_65_12]
MPARLLLFLDQFPLVYAVVIAATLGLAPFTPVPHVWEKLTMLAAGSLVRPIDIFDLALHGLPWLLLAAKLGRIAGQRTKN